MNRQEHSGWDSILSFPMGAFVALITRTIPGTTDVENMFQGAVLQTRKRQRRGSVDVGSFQDME